jgi:hypothetical protein
MKTLIGMAITGVVTLAAVCGGAELSREAGLIDRLGKADSQKSSKPVTAPTKADILAASKTIDEYLAAGYKEHEIKPNPKANDDIFLRRIYLDIAGRVPTLDEIIAFHKSSAADKRSKLIDELLDGEGYVKNYYNFWADLLRIQSGVQGGPAYAEWIKSAIRENKPYDKMVYEILTASGFAWENGAAGFYLRDEDMPLDHMATTIQTFLGTSLVCAQCHDHPFDQWTQKDFYGLAAFTFGVNTRLDTPNVREAKVLAKAQGEKVLSALDNLVRPLTYGVSDSNRQLHLPHDYKYKDAHANDLVKPKVIFGKVEASADPKGLRDAYAKWIIDRQNPRFTQVIANRMWKRVMGIALIEPIDSMTSSSEPTNPQLMAFLSHKMLAYNYDLKQFVRMLYNTDLYQRQVTVEDLVDGEPYYYPGPLLHRMTAEQFWDSLMTLVVPEIDHRSGPMDGYGYSSRMVAMQEASPESLVSLASQIAEYNDARREIFTQIKAARAAKDPKQVEALNAKLNAIKAPDYGLLNGGKMMAKGDMKPDMKDMKDMKGDMKGEMMSKSTGKSGVDSIRPIELTRDAKASKVDPSIWKEYPGEFVRASELNSPANFSHFLRQFGQSDRELINHSNDEANIIQVLAMFNGPMFKAVMSPNSVLMRNVAKAGSPSLKAQIIFQSLLSRDPTPVERDIMASALSGKQDYGRIVWALLNTREFSFAQ